MISHSLVILGGHLQTSRIKWTTFPWMSPEWAASWWPCAYKVSSSSPCFSSSSFGVSTYYSTSAGHARRWERNENTGYSALILLVWMLTILAVGVCFCQVFAVGRRSSPAWGQRCCGGEEESFGLPAGCWVNGGQPAYPTGAQQGITFTLLFGAKLHC